MTRLSAAAVAGGLGVLLTAACGPVSAAGRVTLGGDAGEVCVPTRHGQTMLVGEVLSVGPTSVQVSGIELSGAAGVLVVDGYVLPVDGTVIGTPEFPPEDTPSWQQRRSAVGAQLRPRTRYNVVVKVRRTDEVTDGSSSALKVVYAAGGGERSAEGTTSYRFARKCF